jgi:hypothetical protein
VYVVVLKMGCADLQNLLPLQGITDVNSHNNNEWGYRLEDTPTIGSVGNAFERTSLTIACAEKSATLNRPQH